MTELLAGITIGVLRVGRPQGRATETPRGPDRGADREDPRLPRASDQVNGAPRILADLRADGETVSQKTVAKIMRTNGTVGSARARGSR